MKNKREIVVEIIDAKKPIDLTKVAQAIAKQFEKEGVKDVRRTKIQ